MIQRLYRDGEKKERGAGVITDKCMKKLVLEYSELYDRLLIAKLKKKPPFNISIVVIYAPTTKNTEEKN